MAEFPALPLFTDAYLGDTTHLTTFEHGAYILLLMAAWRSPTADLPDDDKMLSRYTKMTMAQWQKVRPILADFHQVIDGRWCQRRLKDERRRLAGISAANSAAGRASALKKKERHITPVDNSLQRNGNHFQPTTPTPTPTPTPIKTEEGEENEASSKRGVRNNKPLVEYAYEGRIIKLNGKDLDRWKTSFNRVDVRAELEKADSWLVGHPDKQSGWYQFASRWLGKAQNEAPPEKPKRVIPIARREGVST